MANKVSIFIENSEGSHFELTNSKMSLMVACDLDVNWNAIFSSRKIEPYDIILSDFQNDTVIAFGLGYSFIEHCESREEADAIISICRKKLKEQYERMMMIRVAKKYNLDAYTRSKIELEYHDSDNYEVNIKKLREEHLV